MEHLILAALLLLLVTIQVANSQGDFQQPNFGDEMLGDRHRGGYYDRRDYYDDDRHHHHHHHHHHRRRRPYYYDRYESAYYPRWRDASGNQNFGYNQWTGESRLAANPTQQMIDYMRLLNGVQQYSY